LLLGLSQVSHLWFGLGIFPLRKPNFSIFCPSGWVKKYLGQRLVGLLFTAGQKYARVGSVPISNFYYSKSNKVMIATLFDLEISKTTEASERKD